MKIREFGSDFHYLNTASFGLAQASDNNLKLFDNLCFSGRTAFYLILLKGIELYSWKRVYVPSYYCHEVYDFVEELDIELIYYPLNPTMNQPVLSVEDVSDSAVLIVNYFGVSEIEVSFKHAKVIEDLTHDLSRLESTKADFVFGSLRKCLPLPIGGFINSEVAFNLPVENLYSQDVFMSKLSGMYLKSLYLKGEFENKTVFRTLLLESEEKLSSNQTIVEFPQLALACLNETSISLTPK